MASDDRYEVASTRIKRFGVTRQQSVSALSGYLAGVLYLRGDITNEHLGRFYSFLQLVPRGDVRAIMVRERVQGGRFRMPSVGSRGYHLLLKRLGRDQVDILQQLANDRLICSVDRLRLVLSKVPLTRAGSEFSIICQTQRPRHA